MLLLLLLLFGVVAFNSVASLGVKTIGLHGLPNGNQHWALTDHSETELFSHNISDPNHVGVMTHFWMETGRGPQGRYICDNNIIRYYIDGERIASLQFTPSMAAGSAVGREPLSYYLQNQNATPRGSTACAAGQDGCGMDLIDGWPWQTAWTGKSGAEGNWVLHFQIPFARSVRITAQVASAAPNVDPAFSRPDIKPGTVASGYFMTSGLVGPEDSLQISLGYNGLLKLPTIGTGNLRLQMRRLDGFAPNLGDFVPYVQYEAPAGKTVSGAVLMNTIMLQGMHTVYDDVEMCFWALVAANSSFGGGGGGNGDAGAADAGADDDNRPLLIGTGMEDYFANAFSLSNLGRNYYHDDAGLTYGTNTIPRAFCLLEGTLLAVPNLAPAPPPPHQEPPRFGS